MKKGLRRPRESAVRKKIIRNRTEYAIIKKLDCITFIAAVLNVYQRTFYFGEKGTISVVVDTSVMMCPFPP
jgi:hypothetical protein